MFSKNCAWFTYTYLKRVSTGVDKRFLSKHSLKKSYTIKTTLNYVAAVGIAFIGFTYAFVPLYRMFCQKFSYGGTVSREIVSVPKVKKKQKRVITVKFTADTESQMAWNFKPQLSEIKVIPGETALAFYTANNPTEKPIIGISTYNVVPYEAGQYFNKIQCFCFEEQYLSPHEDVDMPVLFFIDPEYTEDPFLEYANEIILSYTFFESKNNLNLLKPSNVKKIDS